MSEAKAKSSAAMTGNSTRTTDEWLLWQLADATFPAGGLAHSGGLEAAVKFGEFEAPDRFVVFLRDQLAQTAHTSLPAMQAAWESPANVSAIDHFLHAFLSNHVANRASVAQGKAFLISAQAAFALPECERMQDDIRAQRLHGHLPIVFGAVARALGLGLEQSGRLFLYIAARSMISAGIRLNVVGALEGQSVLFGLRSFVDILASRFLASDARSIAQTAPLVEMLQACQDRLYSRLFQS